MISIDRPLVPARRRRGRTVLVVDDERSIVDLISDLLTEEGYTVRHAYDGVMALDALDHSSADLMVVDIVMPHLDGLSLADKARDLGIPVLLMSASPVHCADPAIGVLCKPFDIDDLLARVDQLIRHRTH